jgi:hypothetical protein
MVSWRPANINRGHLCYLHRAASHSRRALLSRKKTIAERKGAGTNAATRANIIIGEEVSGILF